MKVLMIGPSRTVHGGISGVVNNLYEAGLDQKVALTYIGTMVDGGTIRKLLQAVWAYAVYLIKLPVHSIVHIHVASDMSYHRKSIFIRTAHFFHKKIVIHQHGGDFRTFYGEELSEKGRKRLRKTFGMADTFLVLTPTWKEYFKQIVPEDKITVLPNTVAIQESGIKTYGQQQILFLGRLCKEKGIRELFAAITALKEKYPKLHLNLGGVWEDPELEREAQKMTDSVTWLGWIGGEEKERLLQQSDIFVLPSWFEGQPVSVLEAMAASCAVAATEVGGIPDMITTEENGLLFSPHNEEQLRQTLDRLLSDAKLCRRLGERAREKVCQEFSIEKTIDRVLEIYREKV